MAPSSVSVSDEEMSSAAQRKVLSTPDLLLIILSQLPHSSLLKAKGVSRTWASLFEHVEIQAALFLRPRPKGSASYVETHSDILMDKFSDFWPSEGYETLGCSIRSTVKRPHAQQWRQLLICQPPIESLELVQQVSQRGSGTIEFRTVIHRPGGIRMGFLYDAVRHWHEVERSSVQLLWNRRTGDVTHCARIYVDGTSFKAIEDKPCITILGKTSVGCGQYGGLTYANQESTDRTQVIKSAGEEVEYCMSEPKRIDFDLTLLHAYREQGTKDHRV